MSGDERKDQSRTAGSVYELRGDEFIMGALSPRVARDGHPAPHAAGREVETAIPQPMRSRHHRVDPIIK
jgi:hypothetical protein